MSYDDDTAPGPHRLKVIGYNEAFMAHTCEINGRQVFVDVLIGGTIPGVTPEDLIGKHIDVNYTHGYVFIASGPRVVADTLSEAKGE